MRPEKRAFLVRVLGAERTRWLLQRLPEAEKALEEMGVAFKDDGALVGRPLGGATSFGQADAFLKASEAAERTLTLVDVFRVVTSNVLASNELKAADKPALLKAAATEFGKRLGQLSKGEKALLERWIPASKSGAPQASPAAGYVEDLLNTSVAPSEGDGEGESVKELREGGGPAADYVADLLTGGAVQGINR